MADNNLCEIRPKAFSNHVRWRLIINKKSLQSLRGIAFYLICDLVISV